MMDFNKISFIIILMFCFVENGLASYTIKGKVNMKGEWQNQIYLATIDRLDDYYNANANNIVNVAPIDQEGNFVLEGDNLPNYSQFYRLYLIKEEHSEFNACLFEGGEEHNFIHLILNNQTQISITANFETFAPFGNYKLDADNENQLMKDLGNLVYPSYMFYEIKFPSELQFSQDKLNRDLLNFADTCSSTLVSLAALNNTDYESYFELNASQYRNFCNELDLNLKDHPYNQNYKRKLQYHSGEELNRTPWNWIFLTGLFALMSLFFGYRYFTLKSSLGLSSNEKEPAFNVAVFTKQELKILQLIIKGDSNKEIAQQLFIELSTVKSHINKLYSKLGVNNRSDAIKKAKNVDLIGV